MDHPRPKKRKILVPVDFSDDSRAALARGVEIACALDAEVVALHVVDTSSLYSYGEPFVDVVSITRDVLAGARKELKTFSETIDPHRSRVAWTEVFEGRPARTIVEAAREHGADLIVMGTHGRTGLSRVVLGSVAEHVVRTAHCDVLVVRAPKPAAKDAPASAASAPAPAGAR